MDDSLEALVERAKAGDRDALEEVVRRIQDRVYGLALRMLWHPEDARDATQEILIRIITRLAGFRGESAFSTWVFRVAANYLLTTRKRRMERDAASFEEFGEDLAEGLADPAAPSAEQRLLAEEVKIGCTQGMLLCLDRPHRLAYVLGEVFEVSGPEGAAILDVSPAAFRKRLSRARAEIRDFMGGHCGLVNPAAACRCRRRIGRAVELGRVDPENLLFAGHPRRRRQALGPRLDEMHELERAAAVFRSHPEYRAPEALIAGVKQLLDSGRFGVLDA